MRRNSILAIAGFVLLAVIAIAGWVRQPAPAVQPMPAAFTGQPVPADMPGAQPLTTASTAEVEPAPVAQRRTTRATSGTRNTTVRSRQYVSGPVYRKRSKKKSALIVGGSAATGAAIGALAGGGKGAAIGAISGGAAGLIYDRSTHKKRVDQ